MINSDAFTWLEENRETFDFVVVDFPDPSNFSIGKLYTTASISGPHRARAGRRDRHPVHLAIRRAPIVLVHR